MENLTAPVALITGASSGIGLALAHELGDRGYKLVVTARNQVALTKLVADLTQKSIEALAVAGDVSIERDCQRMVEESIARFGKLDVLICNAGISMRARFDQTDQAVLEQLMATNFWGTVYTCRYALPYILKQKGSIVGVSSIAGKIGLPGRTGYSASKFAMEGFLQTLRTENLERGLHVLVACPGFTASNIRQTALTGDGTQQGESPRAEQKMMTSAEVAQHISEAIKSRKRDLILTKQGKLTVFLSKFAPKLLDKLVFKTMKKEPGSPLV
jgi:dehydrogenase/reductase SDR family member 7B